MDRYQFSRPVIIKEDMDGYEYASFHMSRIQKSIDDLKEINNLYIQNDHVNELISELRRLI